MKATHSAIIQFESGIAFIDGIPDKCDHNDDGTAFTFGNGMTIPEKSIRCPTNEATQEYAEVIAKRNNTYVSGQTSCCTKCGKIFSLQELMGDAYWL